MATAGASHAFGTRFLKLNGKRFPRHPTAAALPLAKLVAVLAPRVGEQELARVEPMHGEGSSQQAELSSREFRIFGTALVPQRHPVRNLCEAKHLFDSAVAVRRNDQHRTRQLTRSLGNANHYVVMKLALLPVVNELVPPPSLAHALEKRPEYQRRSQLIDDLVPDAIHRRTLARNQSSLKFGRDMRS